ncbi:MAG: hypothetical protein ACUVS6_00715 [Anaerolineae bacterium]
MPEMLIVASAMQVRPDVAQAHLALAVDSASATGKGLNPVMKGTISYLC